LNLRLQRLHPRRRCIGFIGERKECDLEHQRHDQDRHAKISDQSKDGVDQREHRLGDETEPTPVDRKVEPVQIERFVIIVEDRNFLGAGEQTSAGARGAARRNGLRTL
jgi:hypothetical protein